MLKVLGFCLVLFNIESVVLGLTVDDDGVCENITTGQPICCSDHKLHNGRCVSCPIGFIMAVGNCMPCNSNRYGEKCLRKCRCVVTQRCDNVLGCVNETTTIHRAATLSTSLSTEYVTQIRKNSIEAVGEFEMSNPTPTKNINNGLLDREIVIYSVVVACILVILGLSYLVVKYRQKTRITLDVSNTMQNIPLSRRHSLINSNFSIYDEIDENLIVENLNINMVHIGDRIIENAIQINTDNTSYLNPVHSAEDSSSAPVSVNNSYLSIKESDQSTHSDESNRDNDTTSYLHPYHTVDEDWKDKTHQYDVTHVLDKDSDDSSDSNTQMINDGYLHPYQPLKEGWKQFSHSYKAPVTMHQCQQSLMIPFLSNESKEIKNLDKDNHPTTKDEYNMYPSLSIKKDKSEMSENCHQTISIKNSSAKTKPKHTILIDNIVGSVTSSKQEITVTCDFTDAISISTNKKIKGISKSTDNNLEIPNSLKNISTSLEKIKTSTPISIQSERNTKVHDYTDAKSQ